MFVSTCLLSFPIAWFKSCLKSCETLGTKENKIGNHYRHLMDACCVPGNVFFKLFKWIISSIPIKEALFLAHGKLKTCRLHYFLKGTQLAGLGNLVSDVSSWFSPFSGKPPTCHSRRIHAFSYLLFLLSPMETVGSVFQETLTLPSKQSQQIGPWWSNWWRQRGLTSWASSWDSMELWYGFPKEYFVERNRCLIFILTTW